MTSRSARSRSRVGEFQRGRGLRRGRVPAAANPPARLAEAECEPVPGRPSPTYPAACGTTEARRPSNGANTSASPPGAGTISPGTRIDARSGLLLHDRRSEVERPLLFLQEAERLGLLIRHGCRRRRSRGCVAIHIDRPTLWVSVIAFPRSVMIRSNFPARAGFTSTPKIPGRDGASAEKDCDLARAVLELDVDRALGDRLERIERREMDRKARRLADDEGGILREELRSSRSSE